MENTKNEQHCAIHDVIHSAIEKKDVTKEKYVIDGRLDYPIRLVTHTFESFKFGILSYTIGSIMTEMGLIGVYQEEGYTNFDFVKDKIIYETKFPWVLSEDELNEAAQLFLEHCV